MSSPGVSWSVICPAVYFRNALRRHSKLSIFVLLKVMSSYNSNDFAFDCDLLPQLSDSGMSDSIPDEDRALLQSSDESMGGSLSSSSSPPSSITSVPDSLDASDDEIMEEDHPGQRQTTLRLALPRISVVRPSPDDTVIIPVEIKAPRLSTSYPPAFTRTPSCASLGRCV